MKPEKPKIEELKVGETYNFTLLYTGQRINNKFRFESPTGIHYILGLGDMDAVSPVSAPENGTKNTAPAPKYDPCRKFRKGDKVRLREYNGRPPYDYWHKQVIKNFGAKLDTVLEDEITQELQNAVESCENLLSIARQALWSFRDGDPELAWQILGKAVGYGFFDDEYHRNLIRQYIKENY